MSNLPTTPDTPQVAVERTEDGLRLCLPASVASIDAADAQVTRFLDGAAVPVDGFAVRILLREALLNAVLHGSGQDAGKQVRVGVALDRGGVVLTVEDDGPGFVRPARASVPDIAGDGGRGLALMQIYSSEMTFNGRGNRVVMRRNHEAPNLGNDSRERT